MYTTDNQLAELTAGTADWDASLNANFGILERGYHTTAQAGVDVATGYVMWMNSAGFFQPFDPNSTTIRPVALSFTSPLSGESSMFLLKGIVRSLYTSFAPGVDYYVSATTPGLIVSSPLGQRIGQGVAGGGIYFDASFLTDEARLLPTGGNSGDVLTVVDSTGVRSWAPLPAAGAGSTFVGDRISPTSAGWFTDYMNPTGCDTPSFDSTSTSGYGLLFTYGNSTQSGDSIKAIVRSLAVGTLDIFLRMKHTGLNTNFSMHGLIVGQTIIGKSMLVGQGEDLQMKVTRWQSVTSFAATPWATTQRAHTHEWLRVKIDVATLHFYASQDGEHWVELYTEPLSSFVGSVNYVGVAMHINRSGGSTQIAAGGPQGYLNCLFWATSPAL